MTFSKLHGEERQEGGLKGLKVQKVGTSVEERSRSRRHICLSEKADSLGGCDE